MKKTQINIPKKQSNSLVVSVFEDSGMRAFMKSYI